MAIITSEILQAQPKNYGEININFPSENIGKEYFVDNSKNYKYYYEFRCLNGRSTYYFTQTIGWRASVTAYINYEKYINGVWSAFSKNSYKVTDGDGKIDTQKTTTFTPGKYRLVFYVDSYHGTLNIHFNFNIQPNYDEPINKDKKLRVLQESGFEYYPAGSVEITQNLVSQGRVKTY